jgi:hypothetical protein
VSVEAVMTQAVTLRRLSGETRTAIGSSVAVYDTAATTMYLEPRSGNETEADGNFGVGDWLGIGRNTVDFDHWDQVVSGSTTFDIVAPVRPMYHPGVGVSHIEMDLREVLTLGVGQDDGDGGAFSDGFDGGFD